MKHGRGQSRVTVERVRISLELNQKLAESARPERMDTLDCAPEGRFSDCGAKLLPSLRKRRDTRGLRLGRGWIIFLETSFGSTYLSPVAAYDGVHSIPPLRWTASCARGCTGECLEADIERTDD